jgi:hypothetical protein
MLKSKKYYTVDVFKYVFSIDDEKNSDDGSNIKEINVNGGEIIVFNPYVSYKYNNLNEIYIVFMEYTNINTPSTDYIITKTRRQKKSLLNEKNINIHNNNNNVSIKSSYIKNTRKNPHKYKI